MTEPIPKRPWFRFHLLTAVLMMVAAGGFLGANAADRKAEPFHPATVWYENPRFFCKGWPLVFYDFVLADGIVGIAAQSELNYPALILDAVFGLLFIAAVALISESLIRRREGRKP